MRNSVKPTRKTLSKRKTITKFGKALGAIGVVIATGTGLDRLVKESAEANVKLDSLSKNIGVFRDTLSNWSGAAELAGGSAQGMSASFKTLSDGLNRFAIMGDDSILKFFSALDIMPLEASGKIKDMNSLMLELADKFSSMDRVKAFSIAQLMGIDEDTFSLLSKGRAEVQSLLSQQGKLYRSRQQDIETSQKLMKSTKMVSQQFESMKLMIGNAVAPVLLKISQITERFFNFLMEHENLVQGFFFGLSGTISAFLIPTLWNAAKAAWTFIAPFLPAIIAVVGLAAAFGLLYDDYQTWVKGGDSKFNWENFIKYIDTSKFSVKSLNDAFMTLTTGYKGWEDLVAKGKSWLDLKGFLYDGEVSVDSLINGFANLTKELLQSVLPILQRVGETISKLLDGDFKGAWKDVNNFATDAAKWALENNPAMSFVNMFKDNGLQAADVLLGHDTDSEISLTQGFKEDGSFYNKEGATGKPRVIGTQVEQELLNEINKLDWSDEEKAMFMATTAHESQDFTRLRERGGYKSVEQMQKAGIKRAINDPEGAAKAISEGVDAQFNFMYGGRMGNNQEGDGAKYRGRGAIQITGKDNYRKIGKALNVDLVNNPEWLETNPALAAKASITWWEMRKKEDKDFLAATQNGDFKTVTKAVNNGMNGWEDRLAKLNRYSSKGENTAQGINQIAAAYNTNELARNSMINQAQTKNINHNNKIDVVVNGGVNVQSSASTITGVASDAMIGLNQGLNIMSFNNGLS